MNAPAPSPRLFPTIVVRVAGAWILAGALFKLLWGTPNDLPDLIRDLPLDLALTYKAVVAVELFVALLALLRPALGWLPAALLLLLFDAVLARQIAIGAPSCGCFGTKVVIPPWVALLVDSLLLVLLLLGRPWRLRPALRQGAVFVLAALVLAVALPWALDREAKPGSGSDGGLPEWAPLDLASWVGSDIRDTQLAGWVDVSTAPRDGLWFLYRGTCEVCADCLGRMAVTETGERPLVLVHLREPPEDGHPHVVHDLPRGPHVTRLALPELVWVVGAPSILVLENGRVVSVSEGFGPEECP